MEKKVAYSLIRATLQANESHLAAPTFHAIADGRGPCKYWTKRGTWLNRCKLEVPIVPLVVLALTG